MWLLLFLVGILSATEPANLEEVDTIIVEAYRDIQVYVADIKIIDATVETNVETVIDKEAAYTFSGQYWRSAKVPAGMNSWQPVELGDRELRVYNDRTIGLVWDNCNYRRQPLLCSVQNNHYFIETVVHVDDNQLVVKSTLYDAQGQIVNSSRRVNDKIVRWIKQQEITIRQEQQQPGLLGGGGQAVSIHKPKEELPLKWEIPHNLTNGLVQQTMLGLWVGVRLKQ